jgi:hypothetical protein
VIQATLQVTSYAYGYMEPGANTVEARTGSYLK